MKVAPEGGSVTGKKSLNSLNCMICDKPVEKPLSCRKCQCGRYCSEECMSKHENHATYCTAICSLEEIENEKRMKKEIFVSDSEVTV